MKRLSAMVSGVVILLLAAWACRAEPTQPLVPAIPTPTLALADPTPTLTPTPIQPTATLPAPGSTGSITVPQLVIKAVPGNLPAYNRGEWKHWIDADGDCQNTRAEVLIEESSVTVGFRATKRCTVDNGRWLAPYTGTSVTVAGDLDVDHMVPLANAHRPGGWAWSAQRKRAYANDLAFDGHLIAVTASANRSKGAKGPEAWQPQNRNHWCDYAINWITVKSTWGLTATVGEWAALEDMLSTCSDGIAIGAEASTPATQPEIPTAAMPSEAPTGEAPIFDPFGPDRDCGDFGTWDQAEDFYEAAGGPDEDRHRLDRNRDGIACESLRGAP